MMQPLPDARQEFTRHRSIATLGVWGFLVVVIVSLIVRWHLLVDLLLGLLGCYTVATVAMLAWFNHPALVSWVRERRRDTRPAPGTVVGFAPSTRAWPAQSEHAVFLDEPRREDPSLILGATRTGKSTLASQLARQDLARGAPLAVIDPHRDLAMHLLAPAARAGRTVIWFEAGDERWVPAFNPLALAEGRSAQDVARINLEALRRLHFPNDSQTVARFSDTLMHSLWLLAATGQTYLELARLLLSRNFRDHLAANCGERRLQEWIGWFNGLTSPQAYEQATSTLIRLLLLVHDSHVRMVIGQRESAFGFRQVIEGDVFLSALTYERLKDGAYMLGGLLTSWLIDELLRRQSQPFVERTPLYLTIDEFAEQVPESLAALMGMGKTGLRLTLIGQGLSMLDPKLRAVLEANVGNLFVFASRASEAEELARWLFKPNPRLAKSYTPDREVFYSFDEQRTHLETELRRLERFHYLTCRVGTNQAPQLVRVPPMPAEDHHEVAQLRADALARWGRPRADVERELEARARQMDEQFGPLSDELASLPDEAQATLRWHAPY
jgi:hypothetical protein